MDFLQRAPQIPDLLTRHTPYIHLEKPTSLGWKFWAIVATPVAVAIRWARYGCKAKELILTRQRCQGQSPLEEMRIRTLTKIREGYVVDSNKTNLSTSDPLKVLTITLEHGEMHRVTHEDNVYEGNFRFTHIPIYANH